MSASIISERSRLKGRSDGVLVGVDQVATAASQLRLLCLPHALPRRALRHSLLPHAALSEALLERLLDDLSNVDATVHSAAAVEVQVDVELEVELEVQVEVALSPAEHEYDVLSFKQPDEKPDELCSTQRPYSLREMPPAAAPPRRWAALPMNLFVTRASGSFPGRTSRLRLRLRLAAAPHRANAGMPRRRQ